MDAEESKSSLSRPSGVSARTSALFRHAVFFFRPRRISRWLTIFLFILGSFLFFGAGKASAATYYVATSGGSDSNTAVQAQNTATPWATVEYAIENGVMHYGDTLILRGGTYDAANLWKSGTNYQIRSSYNITTPASGTVTIQAYPGESVTIQIPTNSLSSLFSVQGDFLFKGIKFVNANSQAKYWFAYGDQNDRATNLRFEDCEFDNNNTPYHVIAVSNSITNFDASLTMKRCKVKGISITTTWAFVVSNIANGHKFVVDIQSSLFRNMGLIFSSGNLYDLTFRNNTVANLLFQRAFYLGTGSENTGTRIIENNIFRLDSTFLYTFVVNSTIIDPAKWTIKNNIFYRAVTADPGSEVDYIAGTGVSEFFPTDETNFYINPQFTNEGADDYSLLAGTYVSGRGKLASLPSGGDVAGTSWTGTDVGCYANPSATATFPTLTTDAASFVGDSIAEGAGNRAKVLGKFNVVGDGVLGAAIGGGGAIATKWLIDRAAITWHPKYVFITTGHNTFAGFGNSPTNITYVQAATDIEVAMKKAIYWGMTPIWLGEGGIPGADETAKTTKPIAFNNAVQSVCTSNGYNCDSWLSYMRTVSPTNWSKAVSQGGYYQEAPTGPLTNYVHPDPATGDDMILQVAEYLYYTKGTIGTNGINVGAGARIYKDGKFRNLDTASGSTADLSIAPQSSNFIAGDYSQWLDISNIIWINTGTRHKQWTESSTVTGLTNTDHTIGDLNANKYYNITVSDIDALTNIIGINGTTCSTVGTDRTCLSDETGKIQFRYTGGYSDHIFDMTEGDNTAPATTALPATGLYNTAQNVALTCTDNDGGSGCASIHYSTNGTDYSVYTIDPVSISATATLYFYSVDNNGNSETPKTETYTIDTTGPTGSINNDSGNPTNDPTPTFNLTIADAGVGITGAQMQFSCNNSTYSSWEPYAETKTNFNIKTGEGCANADGTKKIYVQFKDSFENIGLAYDTGNFTLDTTASNAALSNTPATHGIYTSSTSANITVGGTDVISYKYKLDSGSYEDETLIAAHLTLSDLAEGSHTLSVIGKDSVGNWQSEDDATSYSWTIDTHAPERSDKSPSGELASGTTSATLSLTTGEVATCKYDTTSKDYADMENSFATTDGLSHSATVSGLTDGGSYNYYVRCQDTAENTNATDYLISFSIASAPSNDANTNENTDDEKDPNLHNLKSSSTEDSITLNWKTDHNTKSAIRYGTDRNLKVKKKDSQKEKKHKVILKDLLPNTKYYFRIKATDSDDNEDSSSIHSIMTKPIPTSNSNLNTTSNENTNQTPTPTENTITPSYSGNPTPNVCSYTVESGDTLWSIAKKVYDDATAYTLIIDKNKDKYTDIESKLSIGQELTFCDNGRSSQTTGNSSNTDKSSQSSQAQIQTEPQTSTFHWWNPLSWF